MLLRFFSNLLGKVLVVSDQNPLPCLHTAATADFDPGRPVSESNPLPMDSY